MTYARAMTDSKTPLAPKRSDCPIASALDVVGDKWTLLVIRDIALWDRRRFKAFEEAGEGIPTNILASRLKQLVEQGIVKKHQYQERPPRYEYQLTERGRDLVPIVLAMARWSMKHVDDVQVPPAISGRVG